MEIAFNLVLPRDRLSVPVVRRITSDALRVLGVKDECVTSLGVALTEACSNVLEHAQGDDDYGVEVRISGDEAIIDVIDAGRGFDSTQLGHGDAEEGSERGRGIQLMRALVDSVRFEQRPERGTVVRLVKHLELVEGAAIQLLEGAAALPEPAAS